MRRTRRGFAGRKRVDAGCRCSYFVLMESEEKKGDRWLRLGDLAAHEVIVVRCTCGRSVEFPPGFLQRRHRMASDTLVYDLQFRLRCSHCNCRSGFRITIFDTRTRGDNWKPRLDASNVHTESPGRRPGFLLFADYEAD